MKVLREQFECSAGPLVIRSSESGEHNHAKEQKYKIKLLIMKILLWIRMLYSFKTEEWVNKNSRFTFICVCVCIKVHHVMSLRCYIALVKLRSWTIWAKRRWFNSETLQEQSSSIFIWFQFWSEQCSSQWHHMMNFDANTVTDECEATDFIHSLLSFFAV